MGLAYKERMFYKRSQRLTARQGIFNRQSRRHSLCLPLALQFQRLPTRPRLSRSTSNLLGFEIDALSVADIVTFMFFNRETLMMKNLFHAAAISILLALPKLALAALIPVHNTGVNASDALVSPGSQVAFWTLSAKPTGAVTAIGSTPYRYRTTPYFADTTTAAWVSPEPTGNAGVLGAYTYDLVIDLTGLDPSTAAISGSFGTDNEGAIWLNGNAPVATTGVAGFGTPTSFSINSGFVPGLNTLHVRVNNAGDPTAFFVSFSSATATPLAVPPAMIPASSWPVLGGLGLLLLMTTLVALRHRRV